MKSSATSQSGVKITQPSLDDFIDTDDFLKDLDVAFEEIQISATPKSKKKKIAMASEITSLDELPSEFLGAQGMFVEMMQLHLKPLVRYMKAIGSGVDSKELIEVVLLVTKPLIQKTKKLSLTVHANALSDLVELLEEGSQLKARKLPKEFVRKLMEAVDLVCEAFNLTFRGHATAVINVLSFYKSLKKNKSLREEDVKKLFAIGIPSLTMLRLSSVGELSSLTGLSLEKITTMRLLARDFTI